MVKVVTRDRYALFRTTRIFADSTVTRDALCVVVHLDRQVSAPYFIKAEPSSNCVSHVMFVRTADELCTVTPPCVKHSTWPPIKNRRRKVLITRARSRRFATASRSAVTNITLHRQGSPYRILFAFNPRRNAYLILGGDKTGDASWYVDAIRRAEAIYAQHLIEIGE